MSWCNKCPRWPVSFLCDFYIRQPMKKEAEPAMMWRPALPHTVHANFPLTSVMPYGGAAYESTGMGTFLFLALERSEKEYVRERNPPLPIGSLCLWLWLLVLLADITYALVPFLKYWICLDHSALWPPFWFHCSPSLLFWQYIKRFLFSLP